MLKIVSGQICGDTKFSNIAFCHTIFKGNLIFLDYDHTFKKEYIDSISCPTQVQGIISMKNGIITYNDPYKSVSTYLHYNLVCYDDKNLKTCLLQMIGLSHNMLWVEELRFSLGFNESDKCLDILKDELGKNLQCEITDINQGYQKFKIKSNNENGDYKHEFFNTKTKEYEGDTQFGIQFEVSLVPLIPEESLIPLIDEESPKNVEKEEFYAFLTKGNNHKSYRFKSLSDSCYYVLKMIDKMTSKLSCSDEDGLGIDYFTKKVGVKEGTEEYSDNRGKLLLKSHYKVFADENEIKNIDVSSWEYGRLDLPEYDALTSVIEFKNTVGQEFLFLVAFASEDCRLGFEDKYFKGFYFFKYKYEQKAKSPKGVVLRFDNIMGGFITKHEDGLIREIQVYDIYLENFRNFFYIKGIDNKGFMIDEIYIYDYISEGFLSKLLESFKKYLNPQDNNIFYFWETGGKGITAMGEIRKKKDLLLAADGYKSMTYNYQSFTVSNYGVGLKPMFGNDKMFHFSDYVNLEKLKELLIDGAEYKVIATKKLTQNRMKRKRRYY
jgi:hypothetical protein